RRTIIMSHIKHRYKVYMKKYYQDMKLLEVKLVKLWQRRVLIPVAHQKTVSLLKMKKQLIKLIEVVSINQLMKINLINYIKRSFLIYQNKTNYFLLKVLLVLMKVTAFL